MTELAAWILFPLIALVICTGIGLLGARLARAGVHPAVVPALGLAGAIVVLGPLFATGLGGIWGAVLLVLLALAGWPLGDWRAMRPSFGALTGGATYALHIAPVAFTGTATFLGYNLLNDTAIHLALVDWIGDHGSRYLQEPPSSYAAAIKTYVGSGYPLGSHELLAALKPLVGLDPAAIYQPFLALCAAIGAAAIFGAMRTPNQRGDTPPAGGQPATDDPPRLRRAPAAWIAFAALASQLVFSFALQGSIKELAFIACLAAAAGVARSPALLAIPAAALFSIYGVAALAWVVPLAIVAFVLWRPVLRAALVGTGVFLIAIAVLIPDSIHYYNHGHSTLTSGEELGPLAGPLQFLQVSGIWLNGDYRFTPNHSWITYGFAIAILALAVLGLAAAIRRRSAPLLLFVVPSLFAFVVTAPISSPYIDAKLLAILSPPVIVAAGVAIAAMPVRAGVAVAAVIGLALFVSDALAYRMALPAPVARLDELGRIDDRFAGQGPILVNEFEEYVKHYMRRSRGSDPYESWTAARADLRNRKLPVAAHRYDLDQMRTSYIERWPLIAVRRSPVESRPPSNYDRVFSGRYYDVWKRNRPAPLTHVALGEPPFDPTEPLDCSLVRNLAGAGEVVAALRPQPIVIPISTARPLPPGWYVYGQNRRMLEIHKGGTLILPPFALGNVHLWLRGRTTRSDQLAGPEPKLPRSLQRTTEWIDAGQENVDFPLMLRRPKRSLRPGDAQPDIVGPLVAVRGGKPRIVSGRELRKGCGKPADWIDVVRR